MPTLQTTGKKKTIQCLAFYQDQDGCLSLSKTIDYKMVQNSQKYSFLYLQTWKKISYLFRIIIFEWLLLLDCQMFNVDEFSI